MASLNTSFAGYAPQYPHLPIEALTNISTSSEATGDTLVYNATTAKWVNQVSQTITTVTTDATAGVIAYSAAEMIGGLILRDPAGAGRADTVDTAANIVAAFPNPIAGSSFRFVVRNDADAAETITVSTAAGITLSGTMTIAQNNSKEFLVVLDNVTSGAEAVSVYSLGTVVH